MIDEFRVARASCNVCGLQFYLIAPKAEVRFALRHEGWTVGKGWYVLCPQCQEEVRDECPEYRRETE